MLYKRCYVMWMLMTVRSWATGQTSASFRSGLTFGTEQRELLPERVTRSGWFLKVPERHDGSLQMVCSGWMTRTVPSGLEHSTDLVS